MKSHHHKDQEASEPNDEGVFARGANLLHNLLAVCDQAKTNHDYNISVEEIDNMASQPGSDAQSFRQAYSSTCRCNCNPERDNPSTLSNTILSKIRIFFWHQAGCMNENNATQYRERDWE
jgi:hypothetical protein